MANLKKTEQEIEARYVAEDREVSQERNDFLLPQILDFVRQKKWMNLRPEYQRRQVWDKKKQSLFIESLLMNLPVPPVFLFEPEYSRYEVMDGQQRLTSIVTFYDNKLKLSGLEYWVELNGKHYEDLPVKVQRGLDRRRMSAVVLQSASARNDEELRRIVFERLNTGGQKLNAQELRNCVYASDFSNLIVELAGYTKFDDMWSIPRYEDHLSVDHISPALAENALFKRMIDCELVLRFFAFRAKRNIRGAVKSILDNTMSSNIQATQTQLDGFASDFRTRIDLAYDLFGLSAFKIVDASTSKEQHSQPFYDAVIIACDRLFAQRQELVRKKRALRDALIDSLADKETYDLIVGRANTADAIKKRLDLVEQIFESVI